MSWRVPGSDLNVEVALDNVEVQPALGGCNKNPLVNLELSIEISC
jgi:hypothetical protein